MHSSALPRHVSSSRYQRSLADAWPGTDGNKVVFVSASGLPHCRLAGQTKGRTVNQEERRQFVRDHRTCIFGYARKEHGPAMTVVYYVMDGDDLLVSTMAERSKAKAVARNERVSLCILDESWPVTYLQVYGTGAVDRDPELATDVLARVIGLMAGQEVPASRRPQIAQMARAEQRVVIRVRPYSTFATPPRHVYQMPDIDTLTHFTSTSMPW